MRIQSGVSFFYQAEGGDKPSRANCHVPDLVAAHRGRIGRLSPAHQAQWPLLPILR